MQRGRPRDILVALLGLGALGAVACGPAAEPTATQAAQKPSPTATVSQPTSTTASGAQPTATSPAAGATATVAEVKVRPVPLVSSPARNPNAKPGGTFVYALDTEPPDFMIWESAVAWTIEGTAPAYDTLVELNSYEDGKEAQIIPNLAYDWWTDATGTKYTLKLNQGMKFSDGVEVTCADVEFMLETLRDGRDATGDQMRRSPRGQYIRRVKDVSCPDNYTVSITTDGPLNSLLPTLTSPNFSILPKHVFQGKLKTLQTQIGPGPGPFLFASYTATESLKYKRTPNYGNKPYPYLDEYHHLNLGSANAVQSAFRVGRLDGVYSATTIPKAVRAEMLKEGRIVLGSVVASHSVTTWETNWQRKPWSDPRFAMAVRCAIDSGKYIATAGNGEGLEVPVLPMVDQPGGSEWTITKEEWKAAHPCHGPSAETDMNKRIQVAQDLMKQLGFGPDKPAKPMASIQSGFATTGYPSVAADLAKIWIEPQAQVVTYAVSIEKAGAGEFDMRNHGYVTNRLDPDQWFYEHAYSTSDRNYGKYTNPEMDALIDKMSRENDNVKRRALVKQIIMMWLRDNPKVYISFGVSQNMNPVWVRDHYATEPNNQKNRMKLIRTWIDQDQRRQLASR